MRPIPSWYNGSFTARVALEKDGCKKTATVPGTIAATNYVPVALSVAVEVGTVADDGTYRFGVGDALSRGQLATVLWRIERPGDAAAFNPEDA